MRLPRIAKFIIIIALITFAFFVGAFVFVLSDDAKIRYSPTHALWPKEPRALVKFANIEILAEIAADDATREQGLGGRRAIKEDEGMLFVFPAAGRHSFWMSGMKFSIDIIWLYQGRIVDIAERVPPPMVVTSQLPIYTPRDDADMVIEVQSGFVAKYGVRKGVAVHIQFGKKTSLEDTLRIHQLSRLPGREFFIEFLRELPPQGKNLRVGRVRKTTDAYTQYEIFYESGELTISGVMNVPVRDPPRNGFPILVLNHGLIDPGIYYTGRGSRREQDFFSRNGYATIHPDYRGHASSSPNLVTHHDFYVGYTIDVMSAIDALKMARLANLDIDHIGVWGHSMGGGMATRVMVLRDDVKAYVLFAPISADAYDNFYELRADEVLWLQQTYGESPESSTIYGLISPITYFHNVSAPVQLHHGTADKDVPLGFSSKIYDTLVGYEKPAELYIYTGQKHEFIEDWQLAANRALKFFDTYLKG